MICLTEVRDFNDSDWMGFQGAERFIDLPAEPLITEVHVGDREFVAVADQDGVQLLDPDGRALFLRLAGAREAKRGILATLRCRAWTAGELRYFGFHPL